MEALALVFVGILLGAGIVLTLAVRRELRGRQERERKLREGEGHAPITRRNPRTR
ncbi:MAG TPA: hypothetical protein VEY09_05765 [Pyrinomonadaceae bacterium]|nr:hypothetical protein [Pyrinomonadaceae bacterium]